MTAQAQWPTGRHRAETYTLAPGALLYRILSAHGGRTVVDFNPGYGSPTRFAFFPDEQGQTVPILYAAESATASICESLLRDVPAEGGPLQRAVYEDAVLAGLRPTRQLALASFKGTGLRALGTTHGEVTSTAPERYHQTVLWAKAAHTAGFDGVAWMSHRCNDTVAVALFGDRVLAGDLAVDNEVARFFRRQVDREWLTDLCTRMNVTVRW